MVVPIEFLSALDQSETIHHPDGRKEFRFPGAEEEAAKRAAHTSAWDALVVIREHEAAIQVRVKQIVEAGPPTSEASPLQAHLAWIRQAQRKAEAAQERVAAAQSAADRHAAAQSNHQCITSEVQEACAAWVDYLGADDIREPPSTRSDELAALASEIEATRPVAAVLPMALFQHEVAVAVLAGLRLMEPIRRAEAVISAEMPRLTQLLDNAVADLERIYDRMASLDEVAQPDWEAAMGLQALGISPPRRLVSTGTTALPAVRGRKIAIDIKADPCAVSRYRASSAATSTALALISPPPPSAPTLADRVTRALRIWTGD